MIHKIYTVGETKWICYYLMCFHCKLRLKYQYKSSGFLGLKAHNITCIKWGKNRFYWKSKNPVFCSKTHIKTNRCHKLKLTDFFSDETDNDKMEFCPISFSDSLLLKLHRLHLFLFVKAIALWACFSGNSVKILWFWLCDCNDSKCRFFLETASRHSTNIVTVRLIIGSSTEWVNWWLNKQSKKM